VTGKFSHWFGSTVLALLIASSSTTAHADPRAAENIPAAAHKPQPELAKDEGVVTTPVTAELPAAYEPWRGTGFGPPPPQAVRDAPAPFARAREHARRPFELGAALATFLPSCGSGSLDDRACLTLSPGSGAEVTLLYRENPYFAFGVEGALSGFGGRGHGLLSGAGGGARFLGVVGRVYFTDQGAWDPYLALTLGVGTLSLRSSESEHESTTGLGGRVAGGIDYVLGARLRFGPTASFARWVAWSEQQCESDICREQPSVYGRLLGFATLGLRVTGCFGDAL
jgi:hypothetical protein